MPMKYAIVCQIKDERLYVEEFAEYHLNLGFDDIFFFEDYGSVSHKDLFENNPHVHINTLEDVGVANYWGTTTQIHLYNIMLHRFKSEAKYDWVAFIDVDEFIVFDKGYNLDKLAKEFDDYAGVWLAWKMYDANGHIKRPEGKVMDNYTHAVEETWNHIIDGDGCKWNKKSFVNIKKANSWINIHEIDGGCDVEFNDDIKAWKIFKKAWINHYFSKSWEDFCNGVQHRGNMANSCRSYDSFFRQNEDLRPLAMKLINEQRYIHSIDLMWLSHRFGILSGGNLVDIEYTEQQLKDKNYTVESINKDIDLIVIEKGTS